MDSEDLTRVERGLADAVVSGQELRLSGEELRGRVLRAMLLGRYRWADEPDPRGIRVRGAKIPGGLDLTEVESKLPLRLVDCETDGPVVLSGARLSTVDLSGLVGKRLTAIDTTIERALILQRLRLRSGSEYGTVSVNGATVGAGVDLSGSHLVNTGHSHPALQANNLKTGTGLFLSQGFRAEGGGALGAMRLSGAEIGGMVSLSGAWIVNLDGPALVADYLSTRSNLMLDDGFHAEGRASGGTVRLVGAHIGGRIRADGGHVFAAGPHDLALSLVHVRIGGELHLRADFTPGLLDVDGLTYGGVPRTAELSEWLELLARRTRGYASQPYFQLAAAYRSAGHERDVRRVHVARQRDLLRRGNLGAGARVWHRITGATVGYGYRPAVALLWWLAVLVASVVLVVAVAGPLGLTLRAGQPGACAVVDEIGLALDTVTPLVKLDAVQRCQLASAGGAGGLVVVAAWILQGLGWAFLTLFVAGFTGLVRRSG